MPYLGPPLHAHAHQFIQISKKVAITLQHPPLFFSLHSSIFSEVSFPQNKELTLAFFHFPDAANTSGKPRRHHF